MLASRLLTPVRINGTGPFSCMFGSGGTPPYRLIKHGQQYVDKGAEYYEARYREQQLRWLVKKAHTLGFQLVPPAAPYTPA